MRALELTRGTGRGTSDKLARCIDRRPQQRPCWSRRPGWPRRSHNVHITDDSVVLSLVAAGSEPQSVYLTPDEARELSDAIKGAAEEVQKA